jgi:hypothetical protein
MTRRRHRWIGWGILALALVSHGGAGAQQWPGFNARMTAYALEVLTVSSTAVGPTAATLVAVPTNRAEFALGTVETADVRCRADGTAPTATVGHLLVSGTSFEVVGYDVISRLSCIQSGVSAASLTLSYFRRP